MEMLVATLVNTQPGSDTDALTHLRLLADAVRNAPGLVSARFYHCHGAEASHLLLTNWEDSESWRRAQRNYNPKDLLLTTNELLAITPEQWLLQYTWGFTRPLALSTLISVHLTTTYPDQLEVIQQAWLQSLSQEALQLSLASGFLARGADEDATAPRRAVRVKDTSRPQSSVLMSFLAWASAGERDAFYKDAHYHTISALSQHGASTRILELETL